jgi:amino acid transporter
MARIAASVFYWLIAASIAELASAMPSSGGGMFTSIPTLLHTDT